MDGGDDEETETEDHAPLKATIALETSRERATIAEPATRGDGAVAEFKEKWVHDRRPVAA